MQLVQEYMEFSSPMNQLFLINAVTIAAEHVIAHQEAIHKNMENHIIHPTAWIAAAYEWQKAVKERNLHNNALHDKIQHNN